MSDVKSDVLNQMEDNELEEGELYVLKKGVLEHLQRDPDDNLRKIRITDDAFETLVNVQRSMRKNLNGYKPDITVVCSAIIKHGASDVEQAQVAVKDYVQKIFN